MGWAGDIGIEGDIDGDVDGGHRRRTSTADIDGASTSPAADVLLDADDPFDADGHLDADATSPLDADVPRPRRYTARVWKSVAKVFDWAGFVSVYGGGVVGVFVVSWVGTPLAMGAQMALGGNTEPHAAHAPWPWVATVLGAVVPWPLATSGHPRLAMVASIGLFFVPWWQLWVLYRLSA